MHMADHTDAIIVKPLNLNSFFSFVGLCQGVLFVL
jgi:hypothetical protein